ncbi:DUF1396 domain-containing protein [Streptomyces sp. NPDC052682]|uniref:DUF1396 domain-containing protein n=1 Tax=Streptomyces sp. NPDC052682 TaxID=3154954 RepID=UPI0034246DBC
MKTSTSISTAGIAALLLAGTAVGCGAEKSPEMSPAAAVAKAAKKTEDIKSFRYTMSGKTPEGQVKGEAQMAVKPSVAMSMKMTVLAEGQSHDVEIRLVDKAMYMGGGAEMAKEMDGKSWMKFDMSALGADKELNDLGAPGDAQQNPAAEAGFLTGAKDVKKVGTEKVGGVETTHYSGTVTLDSLRASLKGEDKQTRERREKSLKRYEKMGIDKLAMDMWVDGEDHAKQVRMKGDTTNGPLDMTITFTDINKPVTVTAPPAKDTVDFAKMMEEAGSEA